ncbi:Transcription factor, fungi [Ophiocordyceps sinensis CO18]|uniref:Transcription factor, fungi n=1 Tax=Ophiocordyceps sinensis (strain Co18 / CGMCC 3.14243) TaxID=911162 RepID=T5AGX8_OPHSC|nr:Transcription factor, fungi [Ophiocordyceps sinensis CO18]
MPYTRGQLRTRPHDAAGARRTSTARSTISSDLSTPAEAAKSLESPDPVSQGTGRVSSHLARAGHRLPRSLFGRNQEVPYDDNVAYTCILPERDTAKAYLECYFEHASTTYRFIGRSDIYDNFDRVYREDDVILQDNMKMAQLLFVLGIGCIWTASWREEALPPWKVKAHKLMRGAESRLGRFPEKLCPTIESLRTYMLKCQLELYSGRFNSAWLTLGLTIRLGQMMNIQKQTVSYSPLEAHYRTSLFWAMFMMDRYLAVSLGRPFAIQDVDVTVPLRLDVDPAIRYDIGLREEKLWVGVVSHARFEDSLYSNCPALTEAQTGLQESSDTSCPRFMWNHVKFLRLPSRR